MAVEQWAQLSELLPLDEESLKQIIIYTNTLPDEEAASHLRGLLGESKPASEFIASFTADRSSAAVDMSKQASDNMAKQQPSNTKHINDEELPAYAPPSYQPPKQRANRAQRRPHTNAIIEAGHVRARDEVCLISFF